MKRSILAAALLFASPALAADPAPKTAPKPPSCGKTVEECDKIVAELHEQVADYTAAYALVVGQRDAAQKAVYDNATTAYVAQQKAARAASPK